MDKEGYAIVKLMHRSGYLVSTGVCICTDHRNLADFFKTEACVSWISDALAHRLENWKAFLSQFPYKIRLIQVPAILMRPLAAHTASYPDDTLPSREVVRSAQQPALAQDGNRLCEV